MKILSFVVILVAVICGLQDSLAKVCEAEDDEPWSYHGSSNDPSSWGDSFPDCNGNNQSPINIVSKETYKDYHLTHLKLNGYDIPVTEAEVINNGHTVMITPQDGVERNISANSSTFRLLQLHFHWGSRRDQGSEHLFDGKASAIEAHFVHANDKGQIAVIGVLFDVAFLNNLAFKPIVKVLPEVEFKDSTTGLDSDLKLSRLLPRQPLHIYRYSGSLTTPACTEGVIWSVAQNRLSIGKRQIKAFRNLYAVTEEEACDECRLVDNFRPVQDLNGRRVTVST